MGKFNRNYLIAFIDLLDEDQKAQDIITNSAIAYATKYHIPRENRLTNDEILSASGTFTHLPARSNALAGCTLDDKIMIVAHGSSKTVDANDASTLATLLSNWGLREIGLITFKACAVGKGFYLDQLLLFLGKKNVRVDWLKGYTGSAITKFVPNEPSPDQRRHLEKLQQRAEKAIQALERLPAQGINSVEDAKAQFPKQFAKVERRIQKAGDAAISLGAKYVYEKIVDDDDDELTGSDRYRIVRGNAGAGERGRYVFKTLAQGLRTQDDFYS